MPKTAQMILFLLMFTAVMSACHYYIWVRLIRAPHLPATWRQVLTVGLVVLGLTIPVTMFVTRTVSSAAGQLLSYLPMLWLGAMMLFVFALFAVDVVRLVVSLLDKTVDSEIMPTDPQRREAIGRFVAGSVGALVFGLTGAAAIQALRKPAILKHKITLSRFPAAMDGFTIVQLSDIHVGLTITGAWLKGVVAQVNALQPDLVVITGDLIDGYVEKLGDDVAALKDLQAKHGVYFITGNHEYYFDAPRWLKFIEGLGIRVLRNEAVTIGQGDDGFLLAGVDDPQGARFNGHGPDIQKALAHRSPEKEVVLLSHQPLLIEEAAQNDVGLMLSGHTHGGQIWPFNYMVGLQQPYNRGYHQHTARTAIYVNQGTGLWGPPMRLGTQSEITHFELHRGEP